MAYSDAYRAKQFEAEAADARAEGDEMEALACDVEAAHYRAGAASDRAIAAAGTPEFDQLAEEAQRMQAAYTLLAGVNYYKRLEIMAAFAD